MMSNLTSNFSITDMCQVSGLNRRNLFYNFKRYFGTSPYKYFLMLKLNAIRVTLNNAKYGDIKIGELMSRYNFYNFSEFSSIYKNTFGESPSMTLSK
jgi:AraC-like DNA-binding protein